MSDLGGPYLNGSGGVESILQGIGDWVLDTQGDNSTRMVFLDFTDQVRVPLSGAPPPFDNRTGVRTLHRTECLRAHTDPVHDRTQFPDFEPARVRVRSRDREVPDCHEPAQLRTDGGRPSQMHRRLGQWSGRPVQCMVDRAERNVARRWAARTSPSSWASRPRRERSSRPTWATSTSRSGSRSPRSRRSAAEGLHHWAIRRDGPARGTALRRGIDGMRDEDSALRAARNTSLVAPDRLREAQHGVRDNTWTSTIPGRERGWYTDLCH